MNKIIARYKITYPDYADGNGMSQYKNLIEYDDYIEDIKPKYNEIALLEAEQTKYSKKMKNIKNVIEKFLNLNLISRKIMVMNFSQIKDFFIIPKTIMALWFYLNGKVVNIGLY